MAKEGLQSVGQAARILTRATAHFEMVAWLSGRASPSHGGGHRFKSCSDHHETSRSPVFGDLLFSRPKSPSGHNQGTTARTHAVLTSKIAVAVRPPRTPEQNLSTSLSLLRARNADPKLANAIAPLPRSSGGGRSLTTEYPGVRDHAKPGGYGIQSDRLGAAWLSHSPCNGESIWISVGSPLVVGSSIPI